MNDKKHQKSLTRVSERGEIDQFLQKVATTGATLSKDRSGRLIFAMDATASREHTWDHACHIQAEMFADTEVLGGLEIQLCYYRGFGEFFSSQWHQTPDSLLREMTSVRCFAGTTQIREILNLALTEAANGHVQAVVFVGDAMEENIDELGHLAGKLGLMNVPVFVFQEGHDRLAEKAFRQIARLTSGAYCRFNANSPQLLKELLSAVAIFAAGGRKALENHSRSSSDTMQLITQQLKGS